MASLSQGLALGIAALVAVGGSAPDARGAPSGVHVGALVATAPMDWTEPLSLVRTDTERRVFLSSGQHVASFTSDGDIIARWDVPDDLRPSTAVVLDVSPAGELFAAEAGGATVHRYAADGRPIGSWSGTGGAGALGRVTGIAYDPRGSVVVSDAEYRGGPIAQKRFTNEGTYLGPVPGLTQQTTIGPSGRRWTAASASVTGYLPSGRQFQVLGDDCTPGGGERVPCATGIGTFGGAPPEDLSAGPGDGLLAVGPVDRVQLFGPAGRVAFACDRLLPGSRVVTADFDGSRHIVVGSERHVHRAAFTRDAARRCRRPPLAIAGLRLGADRILRYRLSTRATVQVRLWKVENGVTTGMATRGAPGQRGRNQLRIRRCDARGCLERGRWHVSLRATDRRSNRADTPALLSVRF